jgi:type I restriction enzyme R subunit
MISDLPLSVNVVEKEKELIHEVLNNDYLGKADETSLTLLNQKLAPLMQYRDEAFTPDQDALDLQDITREKEYIVFGSAHESLTIQKYKEKVEALINKLSTENEILQKIKQGEEITSAEIEKLANTLADYEPYPTEENLQKAYDARNVRFIDLIKYILGLSGLVTFSERVTEAFADFIASHNTFTPVQIQFLKVIRDYIIANGTITKKNLVNAPFTQIHSNGILGVFTTPMQEEIWALTNQMTNQVNYA